MRVLAIPAKKARQRPATYLEAEDVRLIISIVGAGRKLTHL